MLKLGKDRNCIKECAHKNISSFTEMSLHQDQRPT